MFNVSWKNTKEKQLKKKVVYFLKEIMQNTVS